MKKSISVLTLVLMLFTVFAPLSSVVNALVAVRFVVTYNGVTVNPGSTVTVTPGSSIQIKTSYSESIYWTSYKIDSQQQVDTRGDLVGITITNAYADGLVHKIGMTATTNSGGQAIGTDVYFKINVPANPPTVAVNCNGTNYSVNQTINAVVGQNINISATPTAELDWLSYKIDSQVQIDTHNSSLSVPMTSAYADGQVHSLRIGAVSKNGTSTGALQYSFKVVNNTVPPTSSSKPEVTVKWNTKILTPDMITIVKPGQTIDISSTQPSGIDWTSYKIDQQSQVDIRGNSTKMTVLDNMSKNVIHTLKVAAVSTNGVQSDIISYNFVITNINLSSNQVINSSTKGMIAELSATNVSKYDVPTGSNINYQINFKNSGADIIEPVDVIFTIPFSGVVSNISSGGRVPNNNQIVWTFNNIPANTQGSLTFTISYDKINSAVKVIEPNIVLKQGGRLLQSSGLKQLIYDINSTQIATHDSYMVGYDANTFGPNDYLTRAQAATIFVKVFGVNTNYTTAQVNSFNKYSDVPKTHWATKFIMAATDAGYMAGYENGKFGTNDYVTKGQIITIIANKMAAENRSNSINPFALNQPVIYTNELVQSYGSHWAKYFAAQLTRMNMISGSNYNLDAKITRGETVSLINALLLRGTMDSTGVSFTKFKDVNSSTPYYIAIVESAMSHRFKYGADQKEHIQ